MKKTILALSLLFSLMGIIRSFIFIFYNFEDATGFLNFTLFDIQPYDYAGMTIYIPRHPIHGIGGGRVSMGLINLSFYLTFLSGTFIYYFSKYKETKLLAFNYCLVFLDSILKIGSFILFFNFEKLNLYSVFYIAIMLLYIFICYQFLTKELNSNGIEDDIQLTENKLENASNTKRFLNLFIDSFIILAIVFGYIKYADRMDGVATYYNYFKSAFGDQFAGIAFFWTFKFMYYLLFESVFKTTPAKFITSCYITDEEGNTPSFQMILKRTLLRFVPFESFSFLLGKNLHDDYSDTHVINKKTDHKIENQYTQFLAISFGIVLVVYLTMFNRDFY